MTAELAALGRVVADWVLWMSVWTALLFVAARAVDALTQKRVSPGWRALLYGVLLVRVLLPVRWAAPFGVASIVGTGDASAPTLAFLSATLPSASIAATPAAATLASAWPVLIVPLYVLVAFVLCALWLRTRARIERTLGEPLRSGVEDPPILTTDGYGPAVVGLVGPRIAIPRALAESLPPEALAWVVRHERAHVRRHDHVVLTVVQMATLVLWPLLPVWFAASRVRALIELACDRTTLEGSFPSERRSYQETLLMLASANTRRVVPRIFRHVAPSFGGGSLVERVRDARRTTSLPGFLQGAIVLLAAAAMTACSGLGAEQGPYELAGGDVVLLSLRTQGVAAEGADGTEPGQVLVETQVIATTDETADWLVPAVAQDGGEAVMQLIQEDNRVRIITCPSLVTREEDEATIFVGETRVLLPPPKGTAAPVRPVEIVFVGGDPVESGLKLRIVADPAVNGVRAVEVHFVRVADGKLVQSLDQSIELVDGRRVLLRVRPATK